MKAYGVFSGGGVKGAALAGALQAAEDAGVEFLGFGGTSAGAIVAALAASGHSGLEIQELFRQKPLRSFLHDSGAQIQVMAETFARLRRKSRTNVIPPPVAAVAAYMRLRSLGKQLGRHLGLYESSSLRSFMDGQLAAKRRELQGVDSLTIGVLENATGRRLKIVASDVVNQRAVVYDSVGDTKEVEVSSAVAGSASYPFVFQPFRDGGRFILDGGLASNLPAFLFAEEYQVSRVPTLAFDLIQIGGVKPVTPAALARALVGTALEASDHLIREGIAGIYHVPIEVPARISTFSLDLDRDAVSDLYNAGYSGASRALNGMDRFQWARRAAGDLLRELQTVYGEPKVYQPILASIARFLEDQWDCRNVRCSIMVPTGRGTRMVTYQFGMKGDPDVDLELEEGGGCSGRAFSTGLPSVADLEEAKDDYGAWGMTAEQQAKVKGTQLSMVALPIRASGASPGRSDSLGGEMPVIATLGVDTSTPLRQTGWVSEEGDLAIDRDFLSFLGTWANVISRVMT